jgi:CRP/FNR family transcriptional regulator, cyclic AMP receptor protein
MTGVTPDELAGHAFLRGMPAALLTSLATVSTLVTVPEGRRFFEEGAAAARFWLIRHGQVALDIHVPGRHQILVETLSDGDLLGLSWLSPPLPWQFGAVALADTTAFELDGAAVLAACDTDAVLGYELLRRTMAAASRRLQATRVRLLDLYAVTGQDGDTG